MRRNNKPPKNIQEKIDAQSGRFLPPTPEDHNEIHVVKLSDLVEDPENARLHPEDNREQIRQSLQDYGQVEPLVLQTGTNRIIAGHGRRSVMMEEGWVYGEVIYRDVSDNQAVDLGLRMNRAPELATWNADSLQGIIDRGFNLSHIFAEQELSDILNPIITGEPQDELQALTDGEQARREFLDTFSDKDAENAANEYLEGVKHGERIAQRESREPADRIEREPDNRIGGTGGGRQSEGERGRAVVCPFCRSQFHVGHS